MKAAQPLAGGCRSLSLKTSCLGTQGCSRCALRRWLGLCTKSEGGGGWRLLRVPPASPETPSPKSRLIRGSPRRNPQPEGSSLVLFQSLQVFLAKPDKTSQASSTLLFWGHGTDSAQAELGFGVVSPLVSALCSQTRILSPEVSKN